VIQIDIDPSELGRNFPGAIGLLGDPKRALRKLIDALDARTEERSWARQAQAWVQAWREEFGPLLNSDAIPIRPERLCREVGEALPVDGVLLSDTGYSGLWTGIATELTDPGQSYFRAAGSLGWAFPASLGAKCAVPDRPVICFTGDGGFWYHLSELETARRWGINVVVVVNNNGGFGQCKVGVDDAYGDAAGRREHLYQFCETGFARVAENLGCLGIRVERPERIAEAIRQALDADTPAVVEVITDIQSTAPTLWEPS
jgi:acetolactate synthase-1/2/3 large subunit